MIPAFFTSKLDSTRQPAEAQPGATAVFCKRGLKGVVLVCAALAIVSLATAAAQVVTIDTRKGGPVAVPQGQEGQVDRQYQQIVPTHVVLPTSPMDTKTRLGLIRLLQAEQGFAMRPFPRGHKGLTLVANGKLEPAGDGYLNMVINSGISAKPGDRVVITDLTVDHGKIVFKLNGGPDAKHRFLRHISIGANPNYTNPVVQDVQDPQGARLTLDFGKQVPALTGAQVKALLAPLISFDVKTPVQAFTDTLPTPLKDAILGHRVMVGMSTDMVLFAKGAPRTKSREIEGQMPFEEWIYGTPPDEVDFVRINGNRVIRVEIAKAGQEPEVFTKDEVSGMMRSNGAPVVAENVKVVREGDVQRDPNRQAPAPPPTLRKEGEQLPSEQQDSKVPAGQKDRDKMRPVQMPKPHNQPGYNPDSVPDSQPDSSAQSTPVQSAPESGSSQPSSSQPK
jgi:hypothetical protein